MCLCVCCIACAPRHSAAPLVLSNCKNWSTWNWLIPDCWLISELIDLCSPPPTTSFCLSLSPLLFSAYALKLLCHIWSLSKIIRVHSLTLSFPSLGIFLKYPEYSLSSYPFTPYTCSFNPAPFPALLNLTWKTVTNKTAFWRPFRFLQFVETPGNLSHCQPKKKLPPQTPGPSDLQQYCFDRALYL